MMVQVRQFVPRCIAGERDHGDLTVSFDGTDPASLTCLLTLKREQFNLRFQAATNQLEAPSRIRQVRRTIAQIKTLQSERAAKAAAQKA